MVVALAMIYFLETISDKVSSYTLSNCRFYRISDSNRIYPSGVQTDQSYGDTSESPVLMIGYICSAVTDFVVTFAEDSDIVNLHGWSQGSFLRYELEQCDRWRQLSSELSQSLTDIYSCPSRSVPTSWAKLMPRAWALNIQGLSVMTLILTVQCAFGMQ